MTKATKSEEIFWKKGDWCYCHYELYQIKREPKDKRIDISTGYVETCGDVDEMFLMTMSNKLITGEYKYAYNRISDTKINGLNFPDINRHIESLWLECMKESQGLDIWNDKDKIYIITDKHYKILHNFLNEVLSKIQQCKNDNVDGIRLFR